MAYIMTRTTSPINAVIGYLRTLLIINMRVYGWLRILLWACGYIVIGVSLTFVGDQFLLAAGPCRQDGDEQ